MKPRTTEAMATLIKEAREKIPFNISFDGFCEGRCDECPQKQLECLAIELDDWEVKLKHGKVPNLGDVEFIAKSSKKVYELLKKVQLIKEK